jgi:uncharacterized protein (TIGR01777 family)
MRIVIAGGTGFLGRALTDALAAEHHHVVVLSRSDVGAAAGVRRVRWTPDGSAGAWTAALDGADAIVNLAGESIAGRRWSDAQKARIENSRITATRSLVEAIGRMSSRPAVFVSGSAVGYYGPRGDEVLGEDAAPGTDFLSRVCVNWEAVAMQAAASGTRTVCIRTGLVLDTHGGALPRMLLPFRIGAGGPIGSGRQYWPWIHVRDWVDLVRWAIASATVSGALNATAPEPVTNREFARSLGAALHRPALVPTPAFAMRALLGEMADALLLSGQRAIPAAAERLSFTFRYPQIDRALRAIFRA